MNQMKFRIPVYKDGEGVGFKIMEFDGDKVNISRIFSSSEYTFGNMQMETPVKTHEGVSIYVGDIITAGFDEEHTDIYVVLFGSFSYEVDCEWTTGIGFYCRVLGGDKVEPLGSSGVWRKIGHVDVVDV